MSICCCDTGIILVIIHGFDTLNKTAEHYETSTGISSEISAINISVLENQDEGKQAGFTNKQVSISLLRYGIVGFQLALVLPGKWAQISISFICVNGLIIQVEDYLHYP